MKKSTLQVRLNERVTFDRRKGPSPVFFKQKIGKTEFCHFLWVQFFSLFPSTSPTLIRRSRSFPDRTPVICYVLFHDALILEKINGKPRIPHPNQGWVNGGFLPFARLYRWFAFATLGYNALHFSILWSTLPLNEIFLRLMKIAGIFILCPPRQRTFLLHLIFQELLHPQVLTFSGFFVQRLLRSGVITLRTPLKTSNDLTI